jgi:hypothetical protein
MKKEANLAVQISSAKPSAGSAVARLNKVEREFTLLRIPFYLVNKLEALLNQKNGNASPHGGGF